MMMRALVNSGPGQLELREVSRPVPQAGQILVRTAACGICATDLEMIAGWERTGFPAVPGHEWSGTVDTDASDSGLAGKRCVADNILSDGGEVGFEHPGGYGEFLVTEASNLHVLPAGFDLQTATLVEPLAVCLRGFEKLGPGPYPRALVFGDGPIGLISVMLLARAGTGSITVVGGRSERLTMARALGAETTVDYHRLPDGPVTGIRDAAGDGFSVIIESSGSAAALEASLALAGKNAKILVLGDYGKQRASFAWNTVLHKEIELSGSATGTGAWTEAVRLATEGNLPLQRLITHRVTVSDYRTGMAAMKNRNSGCIKAVMNWEVK